MDKLIKRKGEFVYLAIADNLSKEKQEIESSKEVLEGLYATWLKLEEYENLGSVEEIKELSRVIARNLVAWDTSKDKKEGLLPEIYLTNKYIYKQLTGVEYKFSDAIKRFNMGD